MPHPDLSMRHRFRNAVETLAVGSGTIQDRLRDAYTFQLNCIQVDDIPEPLRESFASVELYMTRQVARGDEGTIAATMDAISDQDAKKIVKAIVELSYDLENWPPE